MPRVAADLLFVSLAGVFSLLACLGALDMTPLGANMDSDLQNYAQILEVRTRPQDFAADPVAPLLHKDPGAPNLLTALAGCLPQGPAAERLLRVGAAAVFLHFLAYYGLGRWLFGSASLAAVLSLLMSVTVYWGFGTFWGNLHSDPVPRIFYAVLWPVLLALGCAAARRRGLQAPTALLAGLAVPVHTVSALMFGPMLLAGFLLLPNGGGWGRRLRDFTRNAACFAIPAAAYLWWLLHGLTDNHDAALFAQVRAVRFEEDFHALWPMLRDTFWQFCAAQPLLPAGLICAALAWRGRAALPDRARSLLELLPGMALGMAGMCALSALEINFAALLGRQNFGQELLRGTRFLIPLTWLSVTACLALLWPRLPRWAGGGLAAGLALLLCLVSQDKQMLAARHGAATALPRLAWLDTDAAREAARAGRLQAEALMALRRIAAPGEATFAHEDLRAVRYAARRPLLPVYRDGNIIYYARHAELARAYLAMGKILGGAPCGWTEAWRASGAPLTMTSRSGFDACRPVLDGMGTSVFANGDWVILRRR